MIEYVFNHIDWVAAFLSLTGYFLMANQRKKAIIVLIGTNIIWGAWAFYHHVNSLFVLNILYAILNIRTTLIWKKENPNKTVIN